MTVVSGAWCNIYFMSWQHRRVLSCTYCWLDASRCDLLPLEQNATPCSLWERNQTFDTFCCSELHQCMPLVSNADSQNLLLSVLPAALKWSPQWSQPGDSKWKGYCVWPYMSSWGGPTVICTQKWYKVLRLNEEEFRVLHSVCSVGSERTILSNGPGRSHGVLVKWC